MDSDTEDQVEKKFAKGPVGRILMIDARDPNNSGSPTRSLDAVRSTVRTEMRSGGTRCTSVCFYNTSSVVRGVVEVFPLTAPTLDEFTKLKNADATAHGQANTSNLADTLWHCSRIFATCSRTLGERAVVLLTRFDDPPPQQQQRPALKRAIDLANLGIELSLINICANQYEPHPFYIDLLQASTNRGPGRALSLSSPVWNINDIEIQLHRKSHRLAASARLCLNLGDDLSIGIGIYHLTSQKDPPRKANLTKDDNELVSSRVATVRIPTMPIFNDKPGPSTAEQREVPLLKSELILYQVYGNRKIMFKTDEIKNMKTAFGPPMMRLLGFKPQSWLCKEKYYLKSCQFVFPDESSIEGSIKAFKAFHLACEQRQVIAVCMLRARVSSHPRIVALWPCSKPLGLNVDIGFDLIHIPYLENKKEVPDPEIDNVPELHNKTEFMKHIVSQLQFDYTPDLFENPKLQSLYRAIEVLALEEDSLEPFIDTTKPKPDKFEKLDYELFETVFGPFDVTAKKRPAAPLKETVPKRQLINDIDEELLKARLSTNEINKYNVNDLKKLLRSKAPPGLKSLTGVKKEELVNLVYEHCI